MTTAKRTTRNTQKYVRNLTGYTFALRLGDTRDSRRNITLQPRGFRGDTAPVNKTEQGDVHLLANLGRTIELITEHEAHKNITKQTTNQQVSHPALDNVLNEKGEKLEQGIVVAEEFNDQGTVVGTLVPDQKGGVNVERIQIPGSEGYEGIPDVPEHVAPEEQADWIARHRDVEGPAAGGVSKVKIEKVQKEKNG